MLVFLVNFKLNAQGKVETLNVADLSDFTRVPEPVSKVASKP